MMTSTVSLNVSAIPVLQKIFYPGAIIHVNRVFKTTVTNINDTNNPLQFPNINQEIDYSYIGIACQEIAETALNQYGVKTNYDKGADFSLVGQPIELKTKEVSRKTPHTICNGSLEEMIVPTWSNSTFKEKIGLQFRIDYVINDATSIKIIDGRLFDFSQYHNNIVLNYNEIVRDVINDIVNNKLSNLTTVKTYGNDEVIFEVYKTSQKSENLNGKWRISHKYMNAMKRGILSNKIRQANFK
jgi:hypothetical protein